MTRWLPATLAMVALFGARSLIHADAAIPPRPLPEAKSAKINIVIDERVTEPRFIIPKSLMGEKKSVSLDVTTIVAGLALTLAFVSGGVWLTRRGKARIVAAIVLAGSGLVFGVSSLLADIPRPPRPPLQTPVALPADVNFSGKVQIEFIEQGDEVKLLVKKAWVTPKKADPKPDAKPTEKPGDE